MNENERPLIEVAREMLESRDAHLYAEERKADALDRANVRGLCSYRAAELVIQGYEARCAEENLDAAMQKTFGDRIVSANKRIAALTADEATYRQMYTEQVERRAELETELAESKARIIAVMHAAKWDQARPAVIGVEVTDEMVERFCRQFFKNEGTWSEVFWTPSDATRNDARNALIAALTSARTVPLASVEPARWMKPQSTIGNVVQMEYYPPYNTPLYEGIPEVSRGE